MKNEIKKIKSNLRLEEIHIFDYKNDKYMDITRISKILGTLDSMSYNAVNRIPSCYSKYVERVNFDKYEDIRSRSKKCVSIRLVPILLLKMHSLSLTVRNELWVCLQKEAYNQVYSTNILEFTDKKGKIAKMELPEPDWTLVKWSNSKVLSNVKPKSTYNKEVIVNTGCKTVEVDFRPNSEVNQESIIEEVDNTFTSQEIQSQEVSNVQAVVSESESAPEDSANMDVLAFLEGFTKIAQEHSILKSENQALKEEIAELKAKLESVQANPAKVEELEAELATTKLELEKANDKLSQMISKFSFAQKYVSENLKK